MPILIIDNDPERRWKEKKKQMTLSFIYIQFAMFVTLRIKLSLNSTVQHSIYKLTMLNPGCATIGGTIVEPGAVAPGAPGAPPA